MRAFVAVLLLAACGRPTPARIKTLPNFSLTSVGAEGKPQAFSDSDMRGTLWVADFIYTTCSGPCPMLTTHLAALQKTLPPAVRVVSFTVDPDNDTPERLAAYAKLAGADPLRWRFVTGDKKALYGLLTEGFSLPVVADKSQPAGTRVTHSTKFALIDGELTVRGFYDGQDQEALAALLRDARTLAQP